MRHLLNEARQIRKDGGIEELFVRSLGFTYRNSIRRVLPTQGPAIWNGVKVPTTATHPQKLGDKYLPVPFHYSIRPRAEGGEVRAHLDNTSQGDQVVIIGGGRGVSSVVAARAVKPSGFVLIYEGSKKFSDIVRKAAEVNDVSEYVSVIEQSVGPEIEVYDRSNGGISPAELPSCDVLELDCEGAEKEIIEVMNVAPRVVIVEMHPVNFDHPSVDIVLQEIESMGYEVREFMTNKGKPVSRTRFIELLDENRNKGGEAPVLIAVKEGGAD